LSVEIVPRWEWRTFGNDFGAAEEALNALEVERFEESADLYLLFRDSDATVKLRHGFLDVKGLLTVDDEGLEQWVPVAKHFFPVSRDSVASALARLQVVAPPPLDREAYTADELLDEVVRPVDPLRAVVAHKRRTHYIVDGCMAEICELRTDDGSTRSLVLESADPAQVMAALHSLGLTARANVCMVRGLKALIGFGTVRHAVIDVGTHSVKLHVGERRADDSWSVVADRAIVTRLGESLDAIGAIQPEPMERTLGAIGALADEAREAGAAAIAAVGTAGLRAATNSADFVSAAESRHGVRIEIIPGEEEGRLAYLAATSGLGLGDGARVVFDTGGGSSQFTFGAGDVVDEQFSVPVGAVGLTERHGLDRAVSEEALRDTLDHIADELNSLDERPSPEVLVGMGGALTNLAAVGHGLADYDADVVHGTRLDRAEIDRQIELYRTLTADERRTIVGLQPNRAEVILAGACVVRTVLTKLGCDALVVSDRGLRHWLIVDRFGLGPPSPER
jgi:exopolyphosphatase / guanosine-5'-triphosphate,3'-diphosphate pyrophosphatase